MEKIICTDESVASVERDVIQLFDQEFKIDLFYRGEKQLFFKAPPSSLIVMYFEIMSKALEKGSAPTELNINIKTDEDIKNETNNSELRIDNESEKESKTPCE